MTTRCGVTSMASAGGSAGRPCCCRGRRSVAPRGHGWLARHVTREGAGVVRIDQAKVSRGDALHLVGRNCGGPPRAEFDLHIRAVRRKLDLGRPIAPPGIGCALRGRPRRLQLQTELCEIPTVTARTIQERSPFDGTDAHRLTSRSKGFHTTCGRRDAAGDQSPSRRPSATTSGTAACKHQTASASFRCRSDPDSPDVPSRQGRAGRRDASPFRQASP